LIEYFHLSAPPPVCIALGFQASQIWF